MTEQEFFRREKEVEETRERLQTRWEAVQNELKNLEEVKTLHIAEDLARLGRHSADKAQQEKSISGTSGADLRRPMTLQADAVEEEEDMVGDTREPEDMMMIDAIDDIVAEMMDEEDEPTVLQPKGFLSGEDDDILRPPESSSEDEN